MALELKQELKLSQKLVLTPQLQQAIKLLQLTRMELAEHINQELTENPVLEETIEQSESEKSQDAILDTIIAEDKWGSYYSTYSGGGGFSGDFDKQSFIENISVEKTSLLDYITWQFKMSNAKDEEMEISAIVAGNLNDDGYLTVSVEEIARSIKKDDQEVLNVLKKIQLLDPVGVAARDLSECLMIQASYYNVSSPIVTEIIKEYLPKLQNKNYSYIAKKLGVSEDEVIDAVDIITSLDPKPGRAYTDESPQYIVPDIYVYKVNDEYIITLNDTGLPRLRISSFYRKVLRDGQDVPKGTKDFIKDRIKSATWLIKSIQQRQKTIYNVAKSIVDHQSAFLDKGIKHLKPLILKEIADDVGVHESTVSRVTNGKYIHTPRGVFELKYFFTGKVNSDVGDDRSVESVKERIKEIISNEDSKKPISDQKITSILKEEGIIMARRTVAKYREMMGILSSSMRKGF